MLAANTYSPEYVAACEARVALQIAAYVPVRAATGEGAALTAFEHPFLNGLVVLLEASFVHRTRALEGKDGNPLNEVRMLANAILRNEGIFAADSTIRYKPAASVLGLEPGDEVRLTVAQFEALAAGFFAELRHRFS